MVGLGSLIECREDRRRQQITYLKNLSDPWAGFQVNFSKKKQKTKGLENLIEGKENRKRQPATSLTGLYEWLTERRGALDSPITYRFSLDAPKIYKG